MYTPKTLLLAAGLVLAAVSGAWALRGGQADAPPPTAEAHAAAGVRVLEIVPFSLAEPTAHWYRAERPSYDRGWLMVLETSPELLVPRQTAEPVLYVGHETAERVNVGSLSGRLVVVVPDLGGLDVERAPVFFGAAELPEQVTRERAREQLAAALARGVTAGPDRAARMQPAVELPDDYELRYFASTLVERHSPQEIDLVEGLRAERLR